MFAQNKPLRIPQTAALHLFFGTSSWSQQHSAFQLRQGSELADDFFTRWCDKIGSMIEKTQSRHGISRNILAEISMSSSVGEVGMEDGDCVIDWKTGSSFHFRVSLLQLKDGLLAFGEAFGGIAAFAAGLLAVGVAPTEPAGWFAVQPAN